MNLSERVVQRFAGCSSAISMFSLTDCPPASSAPLFAASITPGPPPVMTENPLMARVPASFVAVS
jgi:hypothetical protein